MSDQVISAPQPEPSGDGNGDAEERPAEDENPDRPVAETALEENEGSRSHDNTPESQAAAGSHSAVPDHPHQHSD